MAPPGRSTSFSSAVRRVSTSVGRAEDPPANLASMAANIWAKSMSPKVQRWEWET